MGDLQVIKDVIIPLGTKVLKARGEAASLVIKELNSAFCCPYKMLCLKAPSLPSNTFYQQKCLLLIYYKFGKCSKKIKFEKVVYRIVF